MYFEVVSSIALIIGLVVVNVVRPGAGLRFDPSAVDPGAVAAYTSASKQLTGTEFLLNVIPESVVGAFARGDILQVLLFSILFGLALLRLGEPARGSPCCSASTRSCRKREPSRT